MHSTSSDLIAWALFTVASLSMLAVLGVLSHRINSNQQESYLADLPPIVPYNGPADWWRQGTSDKENKS